ncbi:aminoacyl-histidine dipeptidase [Psychrobium sp. 1_MG-2023]|uniref:aminoacyl-histidine dipeptidase n=1 Tax=Psychrobium sp. 1_MG-2023 TaxID=3062624 RepID=UPI000C33965A|nr:aminoacyl-histidine dipeptidase [Psychrobium sp. 1_MG-2023]MDP2560537.1 aminoacyl-histidine dipeptidase [Psychrobium sp. 1_MG-2023]PKF57528.1 cytosol nonspecific dipeptidase [Alteromonadales bacterium alter-6D02]
MPLSTLSPQSVWSWFSQLCAIPHPSKHEEALATYIIDWATKKNLTVTRDTVGNIIIKKPATPGYENRKGVIMQAHLDMVPQKNNDTQHDFLTDPIKPYIDGEWVTAQGTTLGADNGIGLCATLAVLGDENIEHGPLEALLTVDEEAGMTGAFGLEPGYFDGEILLNTDSEEEGEVYMGCAGGVDANISFATEFEAAPAEHTAFSLVVEGLKGGHSGVDIHLGRGNANKVLTRVLFELSDTFKLKLASIDGGSLRNALPREASAELLVPNEQVTEFKQAVTQWTETFKQELQAVEPDLAIFVDPTDDIEQVLSQSLQTRLLAALYGCPHGVFRMSDEIDGVVETSNNLGVIQTRHNEIRVQCLIRSLMDSRRIDTQNTIGSIFSLAGATVDFSGAYPGWKPNTSSEAMAVVRDTYNELFGEIPKVMVIHAGLECGLFKDAYPHWDMVSYGPTIRFPHSPDEKVKIDTVERFWQLTLAILKNIPEKTA